MPTPTPASMNEQSARIADLHRQIADFNQRAEALRASITDGMASDELSRIEAEHGKLVAQRQDLQRQLDEADRLFTLDFARNQNMPQDMLTSLANAPAQTIRNAMREELARRSEVNPTFPHFDINAEIGRGGGRQGNIEAMGEAIYTRVNPNHRPSDRARQFVGMSIPELARSVLEQSGERTMGMSPSAVVSRALGGLHSTSDFPLVLGNVVNRTLRAAYEQAPAMLKRVARRTTNSDFRLKHRLQISEGPRLEKVNESGEFTRGTIEEAKEAYKLETFGRVFGITRQALVNDDLGAFDQLPRRLGLMAGALEAQTLADIIAANPAMSDGKAFFHADHGNLAAGADDDPLSIATLSVARKAMRKQVGLTGELISVTPRFLLVPPDLETAGEQVISSIYAAKVEDANPFTSKLELIVEPRLSNPKAWYVVADPVEIDGLEYAYLESEPGPVTEIRNGFDVDGMEVKVRLDFGAGLVDWRGWYKNPGN